jgi:ATP-dependent RNA helicase SUPV3L1/SUV3
MTGFPNPGMATSHRFWRQGRTSVATDPEIDREFYRLAGFRFLGKARRPYRHSRAAGGSDPSGAAMEAGHAGARPEAAYDGRRFITTTGMLSILGATQDDIEEILKGLGYRADAVPAEEAQAHLAGLEAAQAEAAGGTSEGPKVEVVVSRTAADRPLKPAAPAQDPSAPAETPEDTTAEASSDAAQTPVADNTAAQPAEAALRVVPTGATAESRATRARADPAGAVRADQATSPATAGMRTVAAAMTVRSARRNRSIRIHPSQRWQPCVTS